MASILRRIALSLLVASAVLLISVPSASVAHAADKPVAESVPRRDLIDESVPQRDVVDDMCDTPFVDKACEVWDKTVVQPAQRAASSMVGDALKGLAEEFGKAVNAFVESIFTFWFYIPSPHVADGSPADGGAENGSDMRPGAEAQVIYRSSWGLIWGFAMFSFLVGLGKILIDAYRGRGEAVLTLGRNFLILVATTGSSAAIIQLFLQAGDELAPAIFEKLAAGNQWKAESLLLAIGLNHATRGEGVVMSIVMFLIVLIGAIMQMIAMIFRNAMVYLMVAAIPIAGAAAGTPGGMQWFKKCWGFTLALLLYKPAAAMIYGIGFLLLKSRPTGDQGLLKMLYGAVILFLAALALPMLIKWLVPAAAGAGSSSMFSGGAAIATGAAVVAIGAGIAATGGASLAAGGAAGGAGAAGAGTATAGGSAPPGGGGGGGNPPGGGGGGGNPPGGPLDPPDDGGSKKSDSPMGSSSQDQSSGDSASTEVLPSPDGSTGAPPSGGSDASDATASTPDSQASSSSADGGGQPSGPPDGGGNGSNPPPPPPSGGDESAAPPAPPAGGSPLWAKGGSAGDIAKEVAAFVERGVDNVHKAVDDLDNDANQI